MKLDRIHQISEIIASVAIVASLIFVGIQVNQNTNALETNAATTYSQTWQDQTLAIASNPELAEIYFARMLKGSFASAEEFQMFYMYGAQLKSMEFNFLQWRDGNLSDEIFIPTRRGYGYFLISNPLAAQIATDEYGSYTDAFVAFSKEVLEEEKQRQTALDAATDQ